MKINTIRFFNRKLQTLHKSINNLKLPHILSNHFNRMSPQDLLNVKGRERAKAGAMQRLRERFGA